MGLLKNEDVAERSDVDVAYVHRLFDLGALEPEGDGFREQDVHITALLHMSEASGLTAESILASVGSGELSFDFLESPGGSSPRGSTARIASSLRSGGCRWSSSRRSSGRSASCLPTRTSWRSRTTS